MTTRSSAADLLDELDLTEYEADALTELLTLGRTTAPDLAEAAGIPKARIYGVLDSLADAGYVKIIPGRPKEFQPKSPSEILERAVENQRQEYEQYRQSIEDVRETFLAEFEPLYEQATDDIRPAEELFYVVDVGEPSERETRSLYHDAAEHVHVLTKSFEYFERVEPAVSDAVDRDVAVSALFLDPSHLPSEKREIQAGIVEKLRAEYPSIRLRFSNEELPWRGTFVDPGEDGKAIFLVEEEEVPNHLRQAAITENESFVAGLKRYFDLIWEHDSVPVSVD